jgi:zinc transport system permease protein
MCQMELAYPVVALLNAPQLSRDLPLHPVWIGIGAVGIVGLAGLVFVTVIALYGPLLATAFDEQAARVSGIRTDRVALALMAIIGLIVVGGMYAIGLLLIAAMLVIPVAAAAQIARSYRGTMATSAAVGGGSAVAGLTLAFYVDLTPGASIVLTAIGWYLVATVARHTLGRTRDPAIA